MNNLLTSETIAPTNGMASPRLLRLSDLLVALHDDALAAYEAAQNGKPRGPLTGFRVLDMELGGALAPGLHFVHGGPGVGKTAFALQVAASCAFPCLFVSCEMGPVELLRRHTARVSGQFLNRLKSGELDPATVLRLATEAAAAAPSLALVDATQAHAPVAWLCQMAEAIRGNERHVLVVIDSLHSWAESAPSDADEYMVLNSAIAALRLLAKQLDCAVLAVAERNRLSMSKGGLSAGAGSRKIEYAGETVLELGTEEDAQPSPTGEIDVKLKIAKNRNGSIGRAIPLRFSGPLQRFTARP